MKGNKLIGGGLAVFAAGCLLLTGWIIHKSGVLNGATADGQWALGLAAIAVHLSIAVFGLAMFGTRRFWVKVACGLIMFGAAACSAWQITSFLATEVISVTKARELREKREDTRIAAALELAKERQKTQAELAKGQLKWAQGTAVEQKGRLSRKDMAEIGTKLVVEMGKGETVVLPEPKVEATPLQSGLLAQWVAAKMGWDETALQASPYLLIALMLLLIEVISWPLSSYYWNKEDETVAKESRKLSGSSEPSSGKDKSEPATVAPKDEKVVAFPAAVKADQPTVSSPPKVSAAPRVPAPAPKTPRKSAGEILDEFLARHPAEKWDKQSELARAAGVSPATVSRKMEAWEPRGKVARSKKGRGKQITNTPRRWGNGGGLHQIL